MQQTTFIIIVAFFRENKAWPFLWIVCPADESHEMASLFSIKNNNKKLRMLSATTLLSTNNLHEMSKPIFWEK